MRVDPVALQRWLPAWLPTRRWFGDKARPIAACSLAAHHVIEDGHVVVGVAHVDFADDDGPADYLIVIDQDRMVDGTADPVFLSWLGRLCSGSTTWPEVVEWTQLSVETVVLDGLDARPLGVEQSNTSIRYGPDWVVKLNRRLSYGPSPELEVSALLSRWTGERCAPKVAAALEITTDIGMANLAIAAEFIPNHGDGWSFVLEALRHESNAEHNSPGSEGSIREVIAVAELTADMHGALTADPWSPHLAPRRIDHETAAAWELETTASLDDTLELLDAARPRLSGRSQELADVVAGATPAIRQHVGGFGALVGSQRTRIHGDYHLGQVLRTDAGRYVAIDFDGEPQRSLSERRATYSPLRDVAGMMRSLAYAAGTVQAERAADVDDAWLPAWERTARSAFLRAYLARLHTNKTDVLPRETERIRQSLGALELQKAIYEVAYELNNRPDWFWIPLSQLVRMG